MALRKPWTRRLPIALALGLTAALAATGCTTAPSRSTASARHPVLPSITAPQAARVWEHFLAVSGPDASRTGDPFPALALMTGPERAFRSAEVTIMARTLNLSPSHLRAALRGSPYPVFNSPTFYLPVRAGDPRFFVVDVSRKPSGNGSAANSSFVTMDGVKFSEYPTELFLFEQSSANGPWLLADFASLPVGESLPKLAADSAGYIPTVPPSDASLLARPDAAGALQAAVVDDGAASAATSVVAPGPLTTGLHQAAVNHAEGLAPPHGDVYQWELQGVNDPEFALRTANGGALVFYAMTLFTTVAVPDYINKASPVHPGPPIHVPREVEELLPAGQRAPLVRLSSSQMLMFAAIDPAQTTAKLQVIAMAGGLTSASAS